MPRTRFRLTTFKLAWRSLQSSRIQCIFIVVAMTLGIAGISGVGGASRAARLALRNDSRQWLAADLSINTKDWINEQQTAELNRLLQTGIRWTVVTSAMSMAESDQSPDAAMMAVKAVNPSEYPFYGHIQVEPSQNLAAALGPDAAVVSEDTLVRLQVHVGDTIRIGRRPFRIVAVIRGEPDRFAGTPSAGPRCILSRDGYDRTGIARGGNTELHRVLLRLPPGANVIQARRDLEAFFPDANFLDFREANQQAVWTVETALAFLRVTAFIALAIGSVGIALAVRQHIEQHLYTAVVMKILGARVPQVAAIFVIQILWLTLAAVVIGIPLGWMVRTSILSIVAKTVPLPSGFRMDGASAVESVWAGALAALPALVQALSLLRRVRVAPVLRRYSEEDRPEVDRFSGPLVLACGIAGAGFVVLAGRTLGTWNSAGFLAAGLATCIGAIFVLATIALRLIRRSMAGHRRFCLSVWGMGIANLYRPANRTRTLIVALATGLLMMIATFEATGAVSGAIRNALPFDQANLIIVGFDDSDAQPLQAFLSRQAGLERPVQMITVAWLRLLSVNGIPIERWQAAASTHGIASKWSVGCMEGAQAPAGLAISDDLAQLFGARVGTPIDFFGRDRIIHTSVSEIRRLTPGDKIWASLVVDCHALEGQNLYHHAALRIQSEHLAEVSRTIHERYPTLAVLSDADLTAIIQGASEEALALVRLVAWYAIGAGWAVLLAIVAASRLMRLREIGILAVLGASRRTLFKIYTVEFAAIGLLSGVIGSVLACAFTMLVLAAVFERAILIVDWKAILAATSLAVAATVLAGWWPTYRLLRRKPIESLRRE
jgi:putative ABC transport system permease protein